MHANAATELCTSQAEMFPQQEQQRLIRPNGRNILTLPVQNKTHEQLPFVI
jgi:hypothetical protein